ncbi:restriction endonuclease [Dyella lipolytica]|uniref:Restriction endonuclease n=1 Tax=Dyella lipolytica TaxID=1867835 RepID=A0ABW8IUA1_9GAMM|nr:restriction endonuclease [Dyella lipolytica]
MPALDFKEIAIPTHGPTRDDFEMFARDFLAFKGFKIIVGPDRGADDGRDLIIEEKRTGVGGETNVRWLVSCKHNAHSGSSVTPGDESDIRDRLQMHSCQGFVGFYSTLPSGGLAARLNAANLPYEVQVFDGGRIEAELLASPGGIAIARRYMPSSTAAWSTEHPVPARLFATDPELKCAHCGKDLLGPTPSGILVLWTSHNEDFTDKRVETVYWCCKSDCDQALVAKHYRRGLTDGWEDIPDIIAPVGYIRWIMAVINEVHGRRPYSDSALANIKTFFVNLFPLVSREMTSVEKKQIQRLIELPVGLGGSG